VESARTQLIAKLSAATRIGEGEQIELAFDPHELHLFDPATGTTLAQEPLAQAA
jgi:ABC-type sugar transport system ATPase subunit